MKEKKELLEKAKAAKTVEELLDMARNENIDITEDEAAKIFSDLHKSGELSDEELDNVAGGGCGEPDGGASGDTPKYKVGDKVSYYNQTRGINGMPSVKKVDAEILEVLDKKYGYFYYKVTGDLIKSENALYG